MFAFAYGSNMCTQRIRARVASATPVTIGYVVQRKFVIHKRSDDGSWKADAAFTACPTDQVWGVVYRLRQEENPVLDQHEFLGIGYDETEVNVIHPFGSTRACLYFARHEAIDPSLRPYTWYHDYIIQGACKHQLPESYIDYLNGFESVVDPDSARHARNSRLIDTQPSDRVTLPSSASQELA